MVVAGDDGHGVLATEGGDPEVVRGDRFTHQLEFQGNCGVVAGGFDVDNQYLAAVQQALDGSLENVAVAALGETEGELCGDDDGDRKHEGVGYEFRDFRRSIEIRGERVGVEEQAKSSASSWPNSPSSSMLIRTVSL